MHHPPKYFLWYIVDVCACTCAQLLQFCLTLYNPMYSLHGILQARILGWVAMSSSRVSSQPRDQTLISCISCIAGRFFTTEPSGKPTHSTQDFSTIVSFSSYMFKKSYSNFLPSPTCQRFYIKHKITNRISFFKKHWLVHLLCFLLPPFTTSDKIEALCVYSLTLSFKTHVPEQVKMVLNTSHYQLEVSKLFS